MNTSAASFRDPYTARPWLNSYPTGVPADIAETEYSTLVDIFNKSIVDFAELPAFESLGATQSYANFGRAAKNIAGWLQQQGLNKGDRVGIMSPNILAYPSILFAVLISGGIVVNINPLYTPDELVHQANDAKIKYLFVFENFAHTAQAAWERMNASRAIIIRAGDLMGARGLAVNFISRFIKRAAPRYHLPDALSLAQVVHQGTITPYSPIKIDRDDIAFLQYTGGTTGVAKGAVLLHRNIAANVAQSWAWLRSRLEHKGPHKMITALPLYHIFGLTACCLLLVHIGGCCLLIANPRDLKSFSTTLRKAKFTLFSGVNTLYAALTDYPEIKKVDFTNLIFSVSGGMATQKIVAHKWKALTGCPIVEGYGLSETSPILTTNRPDIEEFSGAIGYPAPSTYLSLRTPTGDVAPVGEPGELVVKGPQVMPGYWQRADETDKVMTKDGYFRTGDIAVMSPEGLFRIVDRLKDMILVSGFNVYPNEVEDVLSQHPKVREVAVIGVPYKHSGEAPIAFIVARDASLTAIELQTFAHEHLTGYKIPRHYEFKQSLPKSNVGKILRRELKEEFLSYKVSIPELNQETALSIDVNL